MKKYKVILTGGFKVSVWMFLWVFPWALFASCKNTPGSLQLQIFPTKSPFKPDEPLQIQATLKALEGPICLSKDYSFQVYIYPVNNASKEMRSERPFICGTPFVGSLPVMWPFYVAGTAAGISDVADVLGRFEVLQKGEERRIYITITPFQRGPLYVSKGREFESISFPMEKEWESGEYKIQFELIDADDTGLYPAPLFWRPYSHPARAESRFEIF
ncbi:MAG: hypothetical protein AMJ79_11340 [Phycisphaerae bacterium SM23_30]|nr:MAG: hypothetical protein AMJ79_11340 [Phycisphaerae bacterium SM23_30]